jgi:hypothetical protein
MKLIYIHSYSSVPDARSLSWKGKFRLWEGYIRGSLFAIPRWIAGKGELRITGRLHVVESQLQSTD